ncbi:MAG TPA: phosphate ABC transporter permease PstA, partial [Bacilli bacterium]|nr:phosphate ABC transporter permease PstA [Bacilli bacterium]
TAIYLEEYGKKGRFIRFVQMNISNLAGVPSIVFGLLGLTLFVRGLDLGRSVLAGGLTMSLLILPIIVVAAQEAIRAVPNELREASYGMGATKWQTIRRVILPAALPGILTGNILALSRAIGETAPLIMIGALTYVNFLPEGLFSQFTVMPIQIYNWTSRPQEEFHYVAAAGIIVLLAMLLIMNSVAVWIRNKFQKHY